MKSAFQKTIKHLCLTGLILFATPTQAKIKLGDVLGKAGETIQNLTASDKFEAQDLIGTWKYSSPAVSFKGDNALSNIGGAAASTTIENKLTPYYKKAGLDKFTMTVEQDLTFKMSVSKITLQGKIEKEKNGNLIFNFEAYGNIKIGKISCIATKSGSTLSITFDASKLLKLAETITSISNNSSFQNINSLLKNYDGLYLGAKMKKQ